MSRFDLNRLHVGIVGMCLLATPATSVIAQQDAPPPPPPSDGMRPGGPGGDRMADRMADRLNLTTDQRSQLKAIQQSTRQQEMELRKAEMAKIRALLTDEQRAKFDQMQTQMQQRRGERTMDNAAPPQ
jgi:periplasmic protein CpxP/Spy